MCSSRVRSSQSESMKGTSGVRQTDTPSRSLAGTRPPDSAIVHCFVSLCTCPCTHAVINKPRTAIDHTRKTGRCTCSSANGMYSGTGPRSAVVSASDCGSEGLGFESHQSHVGFFSPGRLLHRARSAMGLVGRLEPHSRASSTPRMRL